MSTLETRTTGGACPSCRAGGDSRGHFACDVGPGERMMVAGWKVTEEHLDDDGWTATMEREVPINAVARKRQAADDWDLLAAEQDASAAWERRMGRHDTETYRNRAATYRWAAGELRNEARM